MVELKVGDKVNYIPMHTSGEFASDCTIISIELKGSIFNTDMATLDKVVHWVALSELEVVDNGGKNVA